MKDKRGQLTSVQWFIIGVMAFTQYACYLAILIGINNVFR